MRTVMDQTQGNVIFLSSDSFVVQLRKQESPFTLGLTCHPLISAITKEFLQPHPTWKAVLLWGHCAVSGWPPGCHMHHYCWACNVSSKCGPWTPSSESLEALTKNVKHWISEPRSTESQFLRMESRNLLLARCSGDHISTHLRTEKKVEWWYYSAGIHWLSKCGV